METGVPTVAPAACPALGPSMVDKARWVIQTTLLSPEGQACKEHLPMDSLFPTHQCLLVFPTGVKITTFGLKGSCVHG